MKVAVAIALAAVSCGAWAGTAYTWKGGDSGDWMSAANWDPTGVPSAAGDSAIFTQNAAVTLASVVTNDLISVTGNSTVVLSGAGRVVSGRLRVDGGSALTAPSGSQAAGIEYEVSAGGGRVGGFAFPLRYALFLPAMVALPETLPMTFVGCTVPTGAEGTVTVDGKLNARYSARIGSTSITLKLGGGVVHIR